MKQNRQSLTVYEQASDIFFRAATYIRTYGWQESGMSYHGKPRCSMGALESAGPKSRWDKQLATLMYQTLYTHVNGVTLTQFNKRARDGEDVASLLRANVYAMKGKTA